MSAIRNAPVQYGHLAQQAGFRLPIDVYKSNAGYYIGTFGEDGPCSRESREYFPSEDAAVRALATGQWTQRSHP
jgi:hypothetical protein